MPLTWSLAVSTYRRPDILKECVTCALGQTRPPSEVVVIDASDDWEASREGLTRLLSESGVPVRLTYEKAAVPSLPSQRSQAAAAATSDILFMFDDDSLMYPDCAAAIMEVYERDVSGRVLAVGACEAPQRWSPGMTGASTAAEAARRPSLLRRIENRLTAMDMMFLPYEGWRDQAIPPELAGLHVGPARLIGGNTLTVRRSAATRVGFPVALRLNAVTEDFDFSYRLGREGLTLLAYDARLFHAKAPAGRLNRASVAEHYGLNMIFLYRKHAAGGSAARLAGFLLKRAAVGVLADVSRRRWRLPQTRGTLASLRRLGPLWRSPEGELEANYSRAQSELFEARR